MVNTVGPLSICDAPIAICRILPPGEARAFEHGDVEAACRECEGGNQPRHSRADDDNTISGHVSAGSALSIDRCQYLFTL